MKYTIYLLLFMFFVLNENTQAQSWDLEKDKNGVKVYNKKYKNGKIVKGIITMDTKLSALVALIQDWTRATEWINRAEQFKVFEKVSDTEWYVYSEISLPFPYSNRDMITKSILTQNSSTKEIKINLKAYPDKLPEDDNFVRIQTAEGSWIFTPAGSGKVQVTYQMYVDPDISVPLPNFIKDPIIANGIIDTLLGMQEEVKDYQNKELDFIKN